MSSTSKIGKDAKVALATNQVLGIGTWSMDGRTMTELDDSEFGDSNTSFCFGIIDGGTITFAGNHKPTDTTGHDVLHKALDAKTEITTLRLYIDNTSYWEPCRTTGYLLATSTTGNNTVLSHVNITSIPINYDKAALGQISFTARVSGVMVLI